MRIKVEFEETDLQGDRGMCPGIVGTCTKCGHTVETFGTDTPSYKRTLAVMREECPEDEGNYYVEA